MVMVQDEVVKAPLSMSNHSGDVFDRRASIMAYVRGARETQQFPLVRDLDDVAGTWLDGLAWTSKQKKGDEPVCRPASTTANAAHILTNDIRWRGVLAYNSFTEDVVKRVSPPWGADLAGKDVVDGAWTETDVTRAEVWLDLAYGLKMSAKSLSSAIVMVAKKETVHPVRDYLASLEWDGVPRIDRFLVTLFGAPDTPYIRAAGRAWLISAVARVLTPGCKVDTMLILEGPQGIRKSTALCALTGEAWFVELSSSIDPRDTPQLLRGKWIAEFPELAAFKRTKDQETIKAFISRRLDTYRPPYGYRSQDFPRQSVFAGSTNDEKYVKDPTGARRLWPVPCGAINVRHVEIERNQLWAEAVLAFGAGEVWYLTDQALINEAVAVQSERFEESPWTEPVRAWCESRKALGVTVEEVLLSCVGIDMGKWTHNDATTAGIILRRMGWLTKGRERPRRYYPPGVA